MTRRPQKSSEKIQIAAAMKSGKKKGVGPKLKRKNRKRRNFTCEIQNGRGKTPGSRVNKERKLAA